MGVLRVRFMEDETHTQSLERASCPPLGAVFARTRRRGRKGRCMEKKKSRKKG